MPEVYICRKIFWIMNCATTDLRRTESLVEIFEKRRLFLNPEFCPEDISTLTGVPLRCMERLVHSLFGMTLQKLIAMYRVQHSAELLRMGVPFEDLFRYSGFDTFGGFIRGVNHIAY